jgi:hypothetical protein
VSCNYLPGLGFVALEFTTDPVNSLFDEVHALQESIYPGFLPVELGITPLNLRQ